NRDERAISDEDIAKIAHTFHACRGTPSTEGKTYEDEAGYCYSATLYETKHADYALTHRRYVGADEIKDDGEPSDEKIARLKQELFEQFEESERLAAVVREQLGRVS